MEVMCTRGRLRAGATFMAAGVTALAMTLSAVATAGAATKSHLIAKSASSSVVNVALDETFPGFNVLTSADNNYDLAQIIENVWPESFITTNKVALVMNTDLLVSVKQTSAKPQTIVYQINPNAKWSDGVAITVADFIYNWQAQSGLKQYKDVGGKAFDDASTAGYSQIKSVTGHGKFVKVVFSSPFADWKSLFGPMAPAHIAKRVGWNKGFNTLSNVISGSWYKIQSYRTNQFLVLKKNPKYWGVNPALSTVDFTWVATDDSMPTGLKNGELSVVSPASVTQSLVAQTNAVRNTVHKTIAGLEFEHLDFNQVNPYLAKVQVRQAIGYGTDRKQIIADTVGPIAPATKPLGNRMLMPNQPGYVDNGAAYTNVNVAKARSLLAGIGFKLVNGYYQPNYGPEAGQPLTLTISSTTGNSLRSETEQLFQAQMAKVGIKINIQNYDAATFFGTNLPTGQFDIAEFAWVATPFLSGNQSLYCSYNLGTACGSNYNHYANAAVTALVTAGSAAIHPRSEIIDYNRADAILWNDMVTLPLYQRPQYTAWSNKYTNLLPNPSSMGITWNLNQWAHK